ncbi:MAG: DUF1549 domain-containing protein, partial [Planctomycetaceae bacterium]
SPKKKAATQAPPKKTAAKKTAAKKSEPAKSAGTNSPAPSATAKAAAAKKSKPKAKAVAGKKNAAKGETASSKSEPAKAEAQTQAKVAMAEKNAAEAEPERAQFTPYPRPEKLPDPGQVAAELDQLLEANLKQSGVELAPPSGDEDFLRRVSFDLAGIAPSPEEVTLFGIDPDPDKRSLLIDRLLRSDAYAENWARYWRDVLYARAVEQRARLGQQAFETWMAEQLRQNHSWADVTTRLITATGDVNKEGATALIYAQRAEPDEVASEVSRVFLGIQLQCANCHDHPSDQWKRDQFHALAAFFPRMFVRPIPGEKRTFAIASFTPDRRTGDPRADFARMISQAEQLVARLDRDSDGAVSEGEAKKAPGPFLTRLFQQGDTDKDGKLTADEIRKIPAPPLRGGRGAAEYFMPDLQNPQSVGTQFHPAFFLNGKSPGEGQPDLDRRVALAQYIVDPQNEAFSQAFVNRMWAQLLGEGFVMPVDDMGPERSARHPEVLAALSRQFTATGYDIRWLLKTIVATRAYQRQIRPKSAAENPPAFATALATRLRADQLYSAITRVLGVDDLGNTPGRPRQQGLARYVDNSPRGQFHQLFGFDPSTPPDEQLGNLPQALFLMNSTAVHSLIAGKGATRLSGILARHSDNNDALQELYLHVLSRRPTDQELEICREYIAEVKDRNDAFEDILWSL